MTSSDRGELQTIREKHDWPKRKMEKEKRSMPKKRKAELVEIRG